MKTRHLFFVTFLLLFVACINGNRHNIVNSTDITDLPTQQIDTSTESKDTNAPMEINLITLLDKLENKSEFKEADFEYLCNLLLDNEDESLAESIGGLIFELLIKNPVNNDLLNAYLDKNRGAEKNRILAEMASFMCIELALEEYSYERFVKDFKIFENSVPAKASFDKCIANWIED